MLMKIGFDNEEIEKLSTLNLKGVYEILKESNPNLSDSSHFEMLAYAAIKKDKDILNFFKNYFFTGDSEGRFTSDDIELLRQIIHDFLYKLIIHKNEKWDNQILKITDLKGQEY